MKFQLGKILTVTTGRLVSENHIAGLYEILNYMTGDNLFTHQLSRVAEQVKPEILRQHPALADIDASGIDGNTWEMWLVEQKNHLGDELDLTPLENATHLDPLVELEAMVGDSTTRPKVVVIDMVERSVT